MSEVCVAIPVRNGGPLFARALAALATQTVPHALLVCDSGSSDGSVALARKHGARVIEIEPEQFSHGGTRNLLMQEAEGSHVALLTQDAEPADERWLERLLGGFGLDDDVALAYGPYLPRPGASVAVRLELQRWFALLAPDGTPRVDRLAPAERREPARTLMGTRGFFTDANACIAREVWERVPFREVPYAEDRVLAIDMLRAGYAKVYMPDAAVVHSHAYTHAQELRRCFDEWRGLREIYGWREPASPTYLTRRLRGELGAVRRELVREDVLGDERRAVLAAATARHFMRLTGALLGSRADQLPPSVRRWLSLERRGTFASLRLDETLGSSGVTDQRN